MQTVRFTAADVEPATPPPATGPITFSAADIQPPDFQTTNEPPSPSLWEQANTSPFHDKIQGAAQAIANFLSEPHLNEAQMNEKVPGVGTAHAMFRGGVAGMVEGAGHVAESFTTPIGIAMTLAGLGGESTLVGKVPGLARILELPAVRILRKSVQGVAGGLFAGHGVQEVVTAPTLAGKAQGALEAATGALGMAGPLSEARAGLAAYRRTANGAKSAMAFKQAAPPSKSTPYTEDQFQRAMPFLEVEHAKTPIGSLADALAAADSQIGDIEQHIAGAVRQFPEARIRTRPLDAARAVLAPAVRSDALAAGLAELQSLGLDQPLTLEHADAIRLQLNAENKGILRRNRYDVATARAVDPGFAAREAAARSLRDGIYTALEAQGFRGMRQLRLDEGAIIAVRNAIDRQIFNGEKTVAGSAPTGMVRKTAAVGVRLLPVPAMVTDPLARAIAPANRTRDALMARAFGLRRPVFASVAETSAPGMVPPPTSTPPEGGPPPPGGGSGLMGAPPTPTPSGPRRLTEPPRALGPAPRPRGEVVFSNTPLATAAAEPMAPAPAAAPIAPPEPPPTARVMPFRPKPAAPVAATPPPAAAPKPKAPPTPPAPARPVTPRDKMSPRDFARFYEAASLEEQNLLQAGFEPSDILARRGQPPAESAPPPTVTPTIYTHGGTRAALDKLNARKPPAAPPAEATAKLKKPRGKVDTPTAAAAKVVTRIDRVIDTSGTTSAAEIQRRVIDALLREVAPANESTGAGVIAVQVPGDGMFTIERTEAAIRGTIKRILSGGTSPWQGVGNVPTKRPDGKPKLPRPTW